MAARAGTPGATDVYICVAAEGVRHRREPGARGGAGDDPRTPRDAADPRRLTRPTTTRCCCGLAQRHRRPPLPRTPHAAGRDPQACRRSGHREDPRGQPATQLRTGASPCSSVRKSPVEARAPAAVHATAHRVAALGDHGARATGCEPRGTRCRCTAHARRATCAPGGSRYRHPTTAKRSRTRCTASCSAAADRCAGPDRRSRPRTGGSRPRRPHAAVGVPVLVTGEADIDRRQRPAWLNGSPHPRTGVC